MGKEVKAERNSQEAIFTTWTSFWGRGLGLVRNPKKSSLWRPSRVNNILVCFVMGIVYKLAWQPPPCLPKSSTLFLRISVLPQNNKKVITINGNFIDELRDKLQSQRNKLSLGCPSLPKIWPRHLTTTTYRTCTKNKLRWHLTAKKVKV